MNIWWIVSIVVSIAIVGYAIYAATSPNLKILAWIAVGCCIGVSIGCGIVALVAFFTYEPIGLVMGTLFACGSMLFGNISNELYKADIEDKNYG